jgi:outer membrane protein OmpA-like peptidoglycan-associated protein
VRNYLSAYGVALQRLVVDGPGSSEPIAANTTDASRARNRRVDTFAGEVAVG